MTLDLSAEAMALIRRLIETRGYRDANEVVDEALHLLAAESSIDEDEALLRRLLEEGRASGKPVAVDAENLKDHIIRGTPLRPLD